MPRDPKPKNQRVADLEAEIVRRVRARGGLSRVQLARELRLAPSTIGIYVERLVRERFLLETGTGERESAGRPPTWLMPGPDGGRFIGVDFEARNLMATAVDFSQRPLRRIHKTLHPDEPTGRILEKIERAIGDLVADDPRPVLGIGVGVPGEIDPATNVAVHYDFIPDWKDVPLGARLERRFGVPVFLENNIRSMALAELWFGAGRGLRHFVCVGIRSGIAAGIVADGQLLHGAASRAGEIGHWICPAPRPANTREPGPRLERVASLSAIADAARRGLRRGRRSTLADEPGDPPIDRILAAARDGDAFALALVRDAARVHGWVAHQINEMFDPEAIIFAGPLADLGAPFLAGVRTIARELAGEGREPRVLSSTLGRYNGAIGAAALALHRWKPAR